MENLVFITEEESDPQAVIEAANLADVDTFKMNRIVPEENEEE